MAGKFSKVLLGGAVVGAAVAGGLAYFLAKKEKDNSWDEDLEDFEDNLTSEEEDETEDDTPITREYVTIPTEHSHPEEADPAEEEVAEEVLEDEELPAEEDLNAAIKSSVEDAMQNVADRVTQDMEEAAEPTE